jgi:hypothetical protein
VRGAAQRRLGQSAARGVVRARGAYPCCYLTSPSCVCVLGEGIWRCGCCVGSSSSLVLFSRSRSAVRSISAEVRHKAHKERGNDICDQALCTWECIAFGSACLRTWKARGRNVRLCVGVFGGQVMGGTVVLEIWMGRILGVLDRVSRVSVGVGSLGVIWGRKGFK